MTAYVWKTNVSADWANAGDWLPFGPPDAATAEATIAANGVYTETIGAADSELGDSLTFDPLTVNGTLTLGGTLAAMTESSGTVNIVGTLAGGTLAVTGGVLNDTGAGMISSATDVDGGGNDDCARSGDGWVGNKKNVLRAALGERL